MASKRLKLSHATGEYLAKKQMAPNTYRNYKSALALLAESIRDDPWLDNVTLRHIEVLVGKYENADVHNLRLAQYRTFFEWHKRRGNLTRNPVDGLEGRKAPRRGAMTKHRIPVEEWPAILEAAGEYHPLNRAYVACGLYLGQRGNELSEITISDLIRGEDGVIEAINIHRSKTNDWAQVPVFEELAAELELWLAWYGKQCGDDFGNLPPNAYLLPARKPHQHVRQRSGRIGRIPATADVDPYRRITRPYRIVQQALKATGWYRQGEGAHTLRRSIAVAMFQADVDAGYSGALDNVKNLLGHADSSTTEGYLGTSLGRHRLDQRVKRQRLIPADASAAGLPDNVVAMERRNNG